MGIGPARTPLQVVIDHTPRLLEHSLTVDAIEAKGVHRGLDRPCDQERRQGGIRWRILGGSVVDGLTISCSGNRLKVKGRDASAEGCDQASFFFSSIIR